MICKNCSAEFEGKFCPECGTPAEPQNVTEQIAEPVEEQIAEPVAEQVTEAVAENDDVVTETLTPPSPADEEIPVETVPEQADDDFCDCVCCGGCTEEAPVEASVDVPYELPKKKKGKAGLIIAIIAVILIAAFCVASFTDLIFSKEAQFVSVLKNMGTESIEFDVIDSDYIESRTSIDVKSDNELLEDAPTEVLDLINSISLGVKYTENDDVYKSVMTIFEDGKALADASIIITEDESLGKFGFSDIVFKAPSPYATSSKITEEQLEKFVTELKKEFYSVLEKNEPEKGTYSGGFDIGMKANTLTVDLNEQETTNLIKNLIDITYRELDLESMDFAKPEYDGKARISVSALYTGAFSFARNSLGVSIVIDNGEEAVEIIFFSNKENKAIYGTYCDGEHITVTDNFERKNGEQSGKLTVSSNIDDVDIEELMKLSATYTIKRNDFETKISYVDEDYPVDIILSMKNEAGSTKLSLRADYKSKEIGTINIDFKPCEPFDVTIDSTNAIDLESLDEETDKLEKLLTDLEALVEENEDSELISILSSLIAPEPDDEPVSEFEMAFLDVGLEYEPDIFYTDNTAAFVFATGDGSLDLQEFGYNGDVIDEMTETYYMYVGTYTDAQQQAILDSLENTYAEASTLESAYIEIYLDGDYLVLFIQMWDLSVVQNLNAFADAGLIDLSSSSATQLSYKQSEALLLGSGYIKAE